MKNETIHNALNTGVYGGALGGFLGTLTVTEWMTVGGFIVAFLSFLVNWWHKRRLIKIEEYKAGIKR